MSDERSVADHEHPMVDDVPVAEQIEYIATLIQVTLYAVGRDGALNDQKRARSLRRLRAVLETLRRDYEPRESRRGAIDDPLFRDRVPEGAARQCAIVLAEAAELLEVTV